MNILDYIDWRGDLTFLASPFNEVDNLVFSTLAYAKLDSILSPGEEVCLAEAARRYLEAGIDQSHQTSNPWPLMEKAAASERFRNVLIRYYMNVVDSKRQIQFSAVTYTFAEGHSYIAFRGTDQTLVGWREDCNFGFQDETPGQAEAAAYVNLVAAGVDGDFILGGHSKGGNFAVYAAAFCDNDVFRYRISRVYSNDGPGFNSHIIESREYNSILNKVEKIIPESSLIGLLLFDKERRKVIRSSEKGLDQHNPYTWNVCGPAFETVSERSFSSMFMDETLDRWVISLSTESRQRIVNIFFDALESSGIHTVRELNERKFIAYKAVIKAVTSSGAENRSDLLRSLKKLIIAGKDTLKSNDRKDDPDPELKEQYLM